MVQAIAAQAIRAKLDGSRISASIDPSAHCPKKASR